MLVGVASAVVLAVVTFAAIYAWGAAEERRVARAEAAGYHLVCRDAHGNSSVGPCHQTSTGLFLILAPGIVALLGFAAGYRLSGGRIAATYFNGLRNLSQ
jgi:hypothetical protein